MKTLPGQWIVAHRLTNYKELYAAVLAVAGDGELVTAEQVGKEPRDFAFGVIRLVVLKGSEVLYSIDSDGSLDVDFLGVWSK